MSRMRKAILENKVHRFRNLWRALYLKIKCNSICTFKTSTRLRIRVKIVHNKPSQSSGLKIPNQFNLLKTIPERAISNASNKKRNNSWASIIWRYPAINLPFNSKSTKSTGMRFRKWIMKTNPSLPICSQTNREENLLWLSPKPTHLNN